MPSPVEFLEEVVLPELFERLDSAFPEFGWRREARGWTATDKEKTKTLLGARPGRVVCHAPRGVLVHGGTSFSWASYVYDGGRTDPRGADFVESVKKLARLAGVDPSPLERPLSDEDRQAADKKRRKTDLLEAFSELAHRTLLGPDGEAARLYLVSDRGFQENELEDLPLGLCPSPGLVEQTLAGQEFPLEEIRAFGLLPPSFSRDKVSPWTGRLVGELRDHRGVLVNFFGRTISDQEPKYLYLTGAPKADLGAFGLHAALRLGPGLVLVEGVLDLVSLPLRGFPNVAAVGGSGKELSASRWEKLFSAGVRTVTLALDSDEAGRSGTLAAVQAANEAETAPEVFVLSPDLLGAAKDPDAFVQEKGAEVFKALLRRAVSGTTYQANVLLDGLSPESPERERLEAVDRIVELVDRLRGPRAGLEVELVLPLAAQRLGFSLEALEDRMQDHGERRRKEEAEKETRRLLQEANSALGKKEPASILRTLSEGLGRLQAKTETPPPAFSVERLLEETRNTPPGRSSGFPSLDRLEVRFSPGELALLAGRTGHGKTTALVSLLVNWLEEAERKRSDELFVLYSHEEPEVRVFHRLLSFLSAVAPRSREMNPWTSSEIRDWYGNQEARRSYPPTKALDAAAERLRSWERRLLVVFRPSWSAEEIAVHAAAVARDRTVGAVLVDYLQRIPTKDLQVDRRDQEVSAVGRRMKELAVALEAPVVVGAQVNREGVSGNKIPPGSFLDGKVQEALKLRRPHLHHLREGGSEQEADLVLGLFRPRADFQEMQEEGGAVEELETETLEVGLLKSRYGPVGQWTKLTYQPRFGLLRDEARS